MSPGAAPLLAALLGASAPVTLPDAPLDAEACVALALAHSAQVKTADADVSLYRAKADQIEALMSPTISALAYGAPLFKAEGGFGLEGPYRRDLTEWGPYVHGDAQFVVPLSTFGRHQSGQKAADERVLVEKAKAREIRHQVRAEVRQLYRLRLYALSMIPNLENGKDILGKAIERADELFESGSGDVTVADRMKLRYGAGEIDRFLRLAVDGAELATAALKQAMGLDMDAPVAFTDERLEMPEDEDVLAPLEALIAQARRQRPEFAQIAHGKKATEAWQQAERRAYLSTLFVAAVGQADWATERPRGLSAIGYNMFNDFLVGAAIGLKFDFAPAAASAKAAEASAKGRWVAAQEQLALTGVPLQVRKAYQELMRNHDLVEVAQEQVKATRKWMTFSAAGYSSGTAEAKDVLEGVGAYLLSKKNYYDHVLALWQARTDLERFTGADAAPPATAKASR